MNRELIQLLRDLPYHCRLPNLEMAESVESKLHDFSDISLREFLHAVPGLGQETSDVMMLYVFGRAIFPVDTSIYRVLMRHGLIADDADYFTIQDYASQNSSDVHDLQTRHQKLQWVGKTFCKKSAPSCEDCPLRELNGGPRL